MRSNIIFSNMASKVLSFLVLMSLTSATPLFAKKAPVTRSSSSSSKTFTIDDSKTGPTTQNYTRVCDPKRFSDLGLDMSQFSFCDKSLPYDVRAKDLIDRMTLDEKTGQIGDTALAVPRIGLPTYEWWSEALHGVSDVGQWGNHLTHFDDVVPGATSFPTVILTGATFNRSLWKLIGQAVSTEARAMYNLGHAGLTFWSPNINVVRDPRWGRAHETPGEDPLVVGEYGVNYVRGLQDVAGTENATDLNSRPLKVSACCKHYAAYDVDNWQGVDRYHFDAQVTEQDMTETFLRPFEMCVKEGDVSSVMCSYNMINGIPACADPRLLRETIRGEWNLRGYIVSDCDSIQVMVENQKWLNDQPVDAVAQALKAGLDLDCGYYYTNYANASVRTGKVKEAELDSALKNLYIVLMRLGFFDGSPMFEKLGKSDICSAQNIELATEAARQGIVLLRNDLKTLPLTSNNINTIAVVGPHANATSAMIGNYAGVPCRYTSPIAGFSKYVGNVTYQAGCGEVLCKDDSLIAPAVQAAQNADATVLVVGLDLSVEAESLDRTNLLLPGYQQQLIQQVSNNSKGPVILVIMSGGGVDISFAQTDPNIKSIIWAGYPGEEGGQAIADVIFGQYNPGGRLPLTWFYNDYTTKLPMTSMTLRPVGSSGYPGRTYKFYNGPTVYPFGFGLSYTNFTYHLVSSTKNVDVKLNKFQHCRDLNYNAGSYKPPCPAVLIDDLNTSCGGYKAELVVQVVNVGDRGGSEVVMVYWSAPQGIADAPILDLVGFQRVFVGAGQSVNVVFQLDVCKSLGLVDFRGYRMLPSGIGKFVVGSGGVLSVPFQINLLQSGAAPAQFSSGGQKQKIGEKLKIEL